MYEMTWKRKGIHWIRHNLYFFITGLLCIVWFLFRTGTKPSRIEYPCQQASIAGANLWLAVYLFPLISIIRSNLYKCGQKRRILEVGIIVAMLSISAVFFIDFGGNNPKAFTFTEGVALSDVTSDIFVVNGTSGNDGGVSQLLNLMEREGTPFYAVRNGTPKTGLIAQDDVVIIKVNCQWDERGGTNTDLVKALIQAIVDHPDGFTGEIIVADNGQASNGPTRTGGSLSYIENNAEDRSQSMTGVVSSFSGTYHVSTYLWDTITTKQVHEYADGDMDDGFIVNETKNPRTGIRVSYPKFRTHYGTYVSFKEGIWNTEKHAYEEDRLKIINVPVLKSHGQMGVSGAVKHYMGVPSNYLTHAHSYIVSGGMGTEMAETRFPVITVLDAIWINARPLNGPTSSYGSATRTNIIAASTDPVALDYWAAQNILMPAAKSLGYTDLSSMDPENNSSGKFGNWLRLSMMELRKSGYNTTIDRNAMNVYFDIAAFGLPGDMPVTGDWNADGTIEIGVFRGGRNWYLDTSGNGAWGAGDSAYGFGVPGDIPVTGDWNGDGTTEIGVFRGARNWYLDTSGNGAWGAGDSAYGFGIPGDIPVTGDWNSDGKTEIGVFRGGRNWYLDTSGNGSWGAGDSAFGFGITGDKPANGDWNADGKTEIGVFRGTRNWYLDTSGNGAWGAGDSAYGFGLAGDLPITGKW